MEHDAETSEETVQGAAAGADRDQAPPEEGVSGAGPEGSAGQAGFADTVKRISGSLREEVASIADERRGDFASRLDDMSNAVRRSGAELRQQQPWLADVIDGGAARLGSLAGRLRDNDIRTSIDELKSFSKRQPALFTGAALLAGLAAGRLARLAFAGRSGHAGAQEPYHG